MLQNDICPQNSPEGEGFRLLAHGLKANVLLLVTQASSLHVCPNRIMSISSFYDHWLANLKLPSHVKLMLANSCRQTQNWCV